MEKKFRALRTVSVVFKVLAWITLIGGILGALGAIIMGAVGGAALARTPELRNLMPLMGGSGGIIAGILSGLGILIGSLIGFVLFYAYAELVYLIIAIELIYIV
jgi:uncharacterized membrane protein